MASDFNDQKLQQKSISDILCTQNQLQVHTRMELISKMVDLA